MSTQSIESYNVQTVLLQELVNYLAGRPYAEVSGLLNKLMQTVEAQNNAYLAANPIVPVVADAATAIDHSVADAFLAPPMVAKIKKARKAKLTAVSEVNNGSAQG